MGPQKLPVPMQCSVPLASVAPAKPNQAVHNSRQIHYALNLSQNEAESTRYQFDSDDISQWAYDTSADFDSAFSLPSNVSTQPEPLPANHPLLLIKDEVLEYSFQKYREHSFRQCAGESSIGGESMNILGFPDSSAANGSNKTKQQEADDNQPTNRNHATEGQEPQETKDEATFACPYLKKDQTRYRICASYKNTRIRDVKQHLKRYHEMPIYCSLCYQTFRQESVRDNHIQQGSCSVEIRTPPEGINALQRERLKKKVPASQTPEQQWYGIFEILFPGHPKPNSPYINSDRLQSAIGYQEYILADGADLLTSFVARRLGSNYTHEFPILLRAILREGMGLVFDQYSFPIGTNGSGEIAGTRRMLAIEPTTSSMTPSTGTSYTGQDEFSASETSAYSFSNASHSHFPAADMLPFEPWYGSNPGDIEFLPDTTTDNRGFPNDMLADGDVHFQSY